MNSYEIKIFVGGIPRDTTEGAMFDYFSRYGHITRIVIPHDVNGHSRGFAYLSYSGPTALHQLLQEEHAIGDRRVEVKIDSGQTPVGGESYKIFIGDLPSTLDEEGVRQYFETFSHVTNVVLKYDENNHRRGFGFIFFNTEDAVKRALRQKRHNINGNSVYVRVPRPKHANPGNDGGGYQPYGASSVNDGGAFDSRVTPVQPQTPAVVYPYYGYSSPDYRYVNAYGGYLQPQTPAVWYPAPDHRYFNAYGGYGLDGYGNAIVGFYGNPNGSNTLYATIPNQNPEATLGPSPSGGPVYHWNQAYDYGCPGGSWRSDHPQIAQPRPNEQP